MSKEKVLIVGGGFGGIKTALELADDERFDVTLLSENSDFRYYPGLYHTATGGRRAGTSIPFSKLFAGRHVNVVKGKAVGLSRPDKTITTTSGKSLTYDTLILALGTVTNYFNIKGLKKYSFGIKSDTDALKLKAHLHQQLMAEHEPDLNYVVVGAGPTGIELAGALPHYIKELMKAHGVKHRAVHVDLIEAAPRLLPSMPRDTARMVRRQLTRLGVKLYVNQAVQGETADELAVNGHPVRSHTVIWTAGVTNNPFFSGNHFSMTGRGKVSVDVYLQAEPAIFVIGDNANTPYAGMAQTAIHDAKFVARNLKRRRSGKNFVSYNAKKPITVIPVGDGWAALLWGRVRLYGRLGWVARELADLIGFHDFEPWDEAFDQWFTELGDEESCPTCVAVGIK